MGPVQVLALFLKLQLPVLVSAWSKSRSVSQSDCLSRLWLSTHMARSALVCSASRHLFAFLNIFLLHMCHVSAFFFFFFFLSLSTFRVISVIQRLGFTIAFHTLRWRRHWAILFLDMIEQQYTIYRIYLDKIPTTVHIFRGFVLIVQIPQVLALFPTLEDIIEHRLIDTLKTTQQRHCTISIPSISYTEWNLGLAIIFFKGSS